jgi:hypothetical protein
VRALARGFSDADIAEQLVLSPHTVHRHLANIRIKVNVPSRAAAAAFAVRAGLDGWVARSRPALEGVAGPRPQPTGRRRPAQPARSAA